MCVCVCVFGVCVCVWGRGVEEPGFYYPVVPAEWYKQGCDGGKVVIPAILLGCVRAVDTNNWCIISTHVFFKKMIRPFRLKKQNNRFVELCLVINKGTLSGGLEIRQQITV